MLGFLIFTDPVLLSRTLLYVRTVEPRCAFAAGSSELEGQTPAGPLPLEFRRFLEVEARLALPPPGRRRLRNNSRTIKSTRGKKIERRDRGLTRLDV